MSNAELANNLNDVASKLSELDEVNGKLETAKFDLKSTQTTLDQVKKDLADAQNGLSAAQQQNKVAYDETIRAKYKELEDIKNQTADAKQKLDVVSVDLKSAQTRHEQIEASINSMRQKFA